MLNFKQLGNRAHIAGMVGIGLKRTHTIVRVAARIMGILEELKQLENWRV